MFNQDVRAAIRQAGFFSYEVAAALGVSETCFSRQLSRAELSKEKKEHIMMVIRKMAEERSETSATN